MQDTRTVYSVSLLSREVKRLLEASYANIQVEGEISSLSRPASGHQYFSIKDENCQLRCVFFKNSARLSPVKLTDGMQVILSARISLYEQRGDFQLIVNSVVESGEGLLRKKFEQLKSRLSAEGMFDSSVKSALPVMPTRVGIITSSSGAAIHDIISVFKRRCPAIGLLIYPALVQGAQASDSLASAITVAGLRKEVDVLILTRGGGSLEDLWPFNEENVAKAIFHCPIPLISAVGHESDISISDLVADVRAATPTAAAEILSPDRKNQVKIISSLQNRLQNLSIRQFENANQQFDHMQTRLITFKSLLEKRHYQLSNLLARLHKPDTTLDHYSQKCLNLQKQLIAHTRSKIATTGYAYALKHQGLAHQLPAIRIKQQLIKSSGLSNRLLDKMPDRLHRQRALLESQVFALQTLSPLHTLSRGYATLHNTDRKTLVSSVEQVKINDTLQANLADGHLHCKITQIHRDKNE